MAILQRLIRKWQNIKCDPKLNKFLTELTIDENLKNNKLIIFTEAEETAAYLEDNLAKVYGDTVIEYSSKSSKALRKKIEENFDPKVKNKKNEVRILITTDVLAEGVNLHRANVVINYDLPWNPTRVMQRVGRINRVGSTFDKIYVYNFFPTSQGDSAINLEANIISKIQAFHNTLGDDVKYISDSEEVNSFGLYEVLNDKESLEGKEDSRSWLKYLTLIRKIRDEEPQLFRKIKELPRKTRSSRRMDTLKTSSTITFFKYGMLRKMYLADNDNTQELNFFEAVDLLEVDKDEKKATINREFYSYLNNNKNSFYQDLSRSEENTGEIEITGRSLSFIKRVKALYREQCFTDTEIAYLERIEEAVRDGSIVRGKINQVLKLIEGKSAVEILNIIEKEIPDTYLINRNDKELNESKIPETILSEFLLRDGR